MAEPIYIHYGDTAFYPYKFCPIHNRQGLNKPYGGLWASRVDAEFGWKKFNEYEFAMDCEEEISFRFILASNAHVIELHSVKDVDQMPQISDPPNNDIYYPDFEAMAAAGIDAIEYFVSDDDKLYYKLNSWNCDCILVMNPKIILSA